MQPEIYSGILGALLGAVVTAFTIRFNYKDLYARSISKNRMEWINNFREEVAVIVATLKTISGKKPEVSESNYSIIYSAEKARAKLLTRLNLDTSKKGNEYNQVMADVLNEIDFKKSNQDNKSYEKALIDLSRKILEPEWNRVKREAGGDKN